MEKPGIKIIGGVDNMIGWFSVGAAVTFLILGGLQDPKKGISQNMWLIGILSVLLGYISAVLFSIFIIITLFGNRDVIIYQVDRIFYNKNFIEWEK